MWRLRCILSVFERKNVALQIGHTYGLFAIQNKEELPFICMSPCVVLKMSKSSKGFTAVCELALVWLFTCMNPHVRVQITFLSKGATARIVRTYKRFFARLTEYLKGNTCVLSWIRNLPIREYFFPQTLHVFGFSPVCVR